MVTLTTGQAGDNPRLQPLLIRYTDDGARGFRLLADKATRRKAKGPQGGSPPGFDPTRYRHRNSIGRGFNRLKNWRGIATRYDKYALTFLGGLTWPRPPPTTASD